MKFSSNDLRRWCRLLHRDLSYFFAGMVLIYALSGIAMNHRDTFNPDYAVSRTRLALDLPAAAGGVGVPQVLGRRGAAAGDELPAAPGPEEELGQPVHVQPVGVAQRSLGAQGSVIHRHQAVLPLHRQGEGVFCTALIDPEKPGQGHEGLVQLGQVGHRQIQS